MDGGGCGQMMGLDRFAQSENEQVVLCRRCNLVATTKWVITNAALAGRHSVDR